MLGCRYYAMLDGDQEEKDWSTPEKYYIQAVDVFSEGAALASPGVIGIMLGTKLCMRRLVCRCLKCFVYNHTDAKSWPAVS